MPQLMNWWYVITRYNQFPQHLKNEGWKGWIVVYYSGGAAVGLKGYFKNGNKITQLLHFVFLSSCKTCEKKKSTITRYFAIEWFSQSLQSACYSDHLFVLPQKFVYINNVSANESNLCFTFKLVYCYLFRNTLHCVSLLYIFEINMFQG